MSSIAIIAGLLWLPGPLLLATGWCASQASTCARKWIAHQLFGQPRSLGD